MCQEDSNQPVSESIQEIPDASSDRIHWSEFELVCCNLGIDDAKRALTKVERDQEIQHRTRNFLDKYLLGLNSYLEPEVSMQ